MSATVFVDANVLIYSEDGRDPAKQQAALRWLDMLWQRGCGRLSSQTLAEFYVNATRKIRPGLAQGEARAKIRRFVKSKEREETVALGRKIFDEIVERLPTPLG